MKYAQNPCGFPLLGKSFEATGANVMFAPCLAVSRTLTRRIINDSDAFPQT